jgi:hypothetical protein
MLPPTFTLALVVNAVTDGEASKAIAILLLETVVVMFAPPS